MVHWLSTLHILLIGYSRIARRRVIPAIRAAAPGSRISVASRSTSPEIQSAEFTWYRDYADALDRSGADVAYVSLTNNAHAQWAERALSAGLHVIVDKPAFMDSDDTVRLVALARAKRRLIAEATVFSFHPQVQTLTALMSQDDAEQRGAVAVFSFPALPESDFRNQRHLGGGALWDLGPYAVASDRVIFQTPPEKVHGEVVRRRPDGLVVGFSVLFSHGARGSLTGHFGFGTEYQNWLTVFGRDASVSLGRAFTTVPDATTLVGVQSRNILRSIEVPAADSFAAFLASAFQAIQNDHLETFADTLSHDALLLERLGRALGES